MSLAYPCTCEADKKQGILKGVHSVGCQTMKAEYPEIQIRKRIGITNRPNFPVACPSCGAPQNREGSSYDVQVYDCGGKYEPKPQIQNHTDKWWGLCGLK